MKCEYNQHGKATHGQQARFMFTGEQVAALSDVPDRRRRVEMYVAQQHRCPPTL
jgi:hypothetical protein